MQLEAGGYPTIEGGGDSMGCGRQRTMYTQTVEGARRWQQGQTSSGLLRKLTEPATNRIQVRSKPGSKAGRAGKGTGRRSRHHQIQTLAAREHFHQKAF